MERRTSPRYTVTQVFELRFDRERIVHARGVDLSRGGMRCVALEPVDLDASVFVMINLELDDSSSDVSAEARVVRNTELESGEYEVALEFVTLYPTAAARLEDYLRSVADG